VSSENVEIVRRFYERWLAGDVTAMEAVDEELELNPDPGAFWVGVDDEYRGPEGMVRYIRRVNEAFEDYRPEVEDFVDAGGGTVVTLAIEHGRGRVSGAQVESRRTAHVWTLRGGRAVGLDLYLDRERAFEALGIDP
jgi:ketosteroid isomerase-like protein